MRGCLDVFKSFDVRLDTVPRYVSVCECISICDYIEEEWKRMSV